MSRTGFHPTVRHRRRRQLRKVRVSTFFTLMQSLRKSSLLKRMTILLLVFFLMIGLPATVALTFHHGDRVPIETWLHTSDASIEVSVWHEGTGQATMMSLNDYILGVLAAEFQPDTPLGALKAGAVACRTYIIREKSIRGASQTPTNQTIATQSAATQTVANTHGADVTDSGTVDMPFMSQSEMNNKFGVQAPGFLSNLRTAIESTDGLILAYQEKPILAFTTIVTPGKTRDAADVIGSPVPYLKSVSCPADESDPNRVHVLVFKQGAIAKALQITNIDLKNLKVVSADKLGFVQAVSYGKTVWSGAKFAALLGLPSSNFKLSATPSNSGMGIGAGLGSGGAGTSTGGAGTEAQAGAQVANAGSGGNGVSTVNAAKGRGSLLSVTTNGVGSGLGMSLNESSALAKSGLSWTSILDKFYPGTTRELDTNFDI